MYIYFVYNLVQYFLYFGNSDNFSPSKILLHGHLFTQDKGTYFSKDAGITKFSFKTSLFFYNRDK